MNRLSRPSILLALVLSVALLAAACGTSEVVVTQGNLKVPTLGPSELAPDGAESAQRESGQTDGGAEELDATQVTPEPADEPEPEETEPDEAEPAKTEPDDNGTSSGVSLLSQAAANVGQGSYRFEVFFAMAFGGGSFEIDFASDQPLSTGEVSGEMQYAFTDLQLMFDEMVSLLGDGVRQDETLGNDLTMKVILDGTTMYIRAPMFAAMANGAGLPAGLEQLGEGWGVVDLAAMPGFDAAALVGLTGGQSGFSPAQIVALLEAAGSEVEEMGPATVRGVGTTRLRAQVNVLAMMAAQGLDIDSFGGIQAAALDFTLPVDVFVDGEQRVRRVTTSLSLEDLDTLLGDEDLALGIDFQFSTTIDFFDFGADITIDLPDEADIVGDFTELFSELAALAD